MIEGACREIHAAKGAVALDPLDLDGLAVPAPDPVPQEGDGDAGEDTGGAPRSPARLRSAVPLPWSGQ